MQHAITELEVKLQGARDNPRMMHFTHPPPKVQQKRPWIYRPRATIFFCVLGLVSAISLWNFPMVLAWGVATCASLAVELANYNNGELNKEQNHQ